MSSIGNNTWLSYSIYRHGATKVSNPCLYILFLGFAGFVYIFLLIPLFSVALACANDYCVITFCRLDPVVFMLPIVFCAANTCQITPQAPRSSSSRLITLYVICIWG